MKIAYIPVSLIAFGIISCSSIPDAAPGINKSEMKALVSSYYWDPKNPLPSYDEASLATFMDKSTDPDLDGGKAEGYSAALIRALASSGDDLFSTVLLTRSKKVQKSVKHFISSAWTWSKLEYPKTQSIYNQNKTR